MVKNKLIKAAAACMVGVLVLTNTGITSEAAGARSFGVGMDAALTKAYESDDKVDAKISEVITSAENTKKEAKEQSAAIAWEAKPAQEAILDVYPDVEFPVVETEEAVTDAETTEAEEAVDENDTSDAVEAEVNMADEEAAEETASEEDSEEAAAEAAVEELLEGEEVEEVAERDDTVNGEEELYKADELEIPEEFKNIAIAKVTNYVNVRNMPSEEGEIVGKLYDKSAASVEGEEDGWYKITSGHVTGYVKSEYVVAGEEGERLAREVGRKVAVVTTTTLKVRKEPSLEGKVLGLVPIEDELTVLDDAEGWVKVSIEEGDGWVSTDYVAMHMEFVTAESKEEEAARLAKEEAARKNASSAAEKSGAVAASSSASSKGQAVIDFAKQFIGNPYVWGGTSLTHGADCSGFVQSVYKHFGVTLPRTSGQQRSAGYAVGSLAEAKPGDLICYSGHVALYIGNGAIVHASSRKTGIKISPNAAYRKIVAIRRIF